MLLSWIVNFKVYTWDLFYWPWFVTINSKILVSESNINAIYHIINRLLVILQFCKWFDDAVAANLKEPNAMALSTAGKDGKP